MDNMNLPPKPPYQPDKAPRTEQERRMPRRVKIGAGSVVFALLMGGGVLLGKEMSEREDEGIDTRADPTVATASQDPTESSPTASSAETAAPDPSTTPDRIPAPTIEETTPPLTPESLEMYADYKAELDPESLAQQYFDTRNKAIMLGCDQELADEYDSFTATEGNPIEELVMTKTDHKKAIIGEQMGGPAWEGDDATASTIEDRALQNENACISFLRAAEQGKSYEQTDKIAGPIDVIEGPYYIDKSDTQAITLSIPVHTQALVDGKIMPNSDINDPNHITTWDYEFTAYVSIVVHGKQSGEAAGVSVDGAPGQVTILSEAYDGERRNVQLEPPIGYADE